MKKYIFILFALLLPSVVLTSCGDDEPKVNTNNLLGYWQKIRYSSVDKLNGKIERENNSTYTSSGLAFYADGRVAECYRDRYNKRNEKFSKWSLKGNVLTIDYDGYSVEYNVKVCSETELVLEEYSSETWNDGDFYESITTDYSVRVSAQDWSAL